MPWARILLLFEAFATVFQSQISRWCRRDSRRAYLAIVELFLAMSEGLFSFLFFLFSGFRRRRFESFIGLCFACLGYESCCCSRLSQPFSKAKFRDDVGAIPDERTFLFFLLSGFRRRRFESFIGLCFACLGYESCCCSRLSQPFSKAKFRDDVGAIPAERTWL